jgi:hypothetical protein
MSWRRILLLALLFASLLATTTVLVLQQVAAPTAMVRRLLAEHLAAPFTLGGSSISATHGALALHDLRIEDPTRPGTVLVSIAHLQADFGPTDSLLGLGLHRVLAEDLLLDLGPQWPAPADWLRSNPAAPTTEQPALALPNLSLRRATLRYQPTARGTPMELTDAQGELTAIAGRPGHFALSCTAHSADLGSRVQVDGEISFAGKTWLQVSVRDSKVDGAVLQHLQEHLDLDLGGLAVDASLKELQVRCELDASTPQIQPSFAARARLQGLRAAAPYLPRQIRNAAVDLALSLDGGGELVARIEQDAPEGLLGIDVAIRDLIGSPRYRIRARGQNVLVDADAVDALRRFPLGNELMDALQPRGGRGDIDLYLEDAHRRGGVAEFELSLRDGAMAYHGFGEGDQQIGFPLPLVGAHGRVTLRNHVVRLSGMQAEIAPEAGGGRVRLEGVIATLLPHGEDTSLDIDAEAVQFGPALREALQRLLHDDGKLYDRLAPVGATNVSVQVRPRRELAGGFRVRVAPQQATMQWAGFPYRITNLAGEVVAHRRQVDFDLRGMHGAGSLQLRGYIPLGDGGTDAVDGFVANIQVNGLPLDDELRDALAVCAPALAEPWRQSRPHGALSGEVRLCRQRPQQPLQHDARLELDGVTLQLPVHPWVASDLRGVLFVRGDDDGGSLQFDGLRGRLGHEQATAAATLAVLGNLQHAAGALTHSDLALLVGQLPLSAQLGQTLTELQALPNGVWQMLQPAGSIDCSAHYRLAPAGAPRLALDLDLRDVSSHAAVLPHPATAIHGRLHIADRELRFPHLQAIVGGALVHCRDGRIGPAAEPGGLTEIRCRVAARGFVLDDGIANLFEGPLRQAILARQLRGKADVQELRLRWLLHPDPAAPQQATQLDGTFQLYDVGLQLGSGSGGLRLEQLHCLVALEPSHVDANGGQLAGTLGRGALRMFGQPFDDIEGEFRVDAERLLLAGFQCRWQGGRLRGGNGTEPAFRFLLPAPAVPAGRLAANLAFDKVDLASFLRDCGWQRHPYSGLCSGTLQLEQLDGTAITEARGNASVTVEQADLGAVPLFTAIYTHLPPAERPRFDRLQASGRLQQRQLQLDKLALRSSMLEANGSGTLGLDGYVDVELKLDNLMGANADPLLLPLIDLFAKSLVSFHLTGHLRDLVASRRWLMERPPARRPVPPLPPSLPAVPLPRY